MEVYIATVIVITLLVCCLSCDATGRVSASGSADVIVAGGRCIICE